VFDAAVVDEIYRVRNDEAVDTVPVFSQPGTLPGSLLRFNSL
jgi:hypothetical protein